MKTEIEKKEYFDLQPTTYEQAMQYAQLIADSSFAPKDYKGKAGDILVAIQMGYEIGLKPLQALQNIAVINGRPCLWGDAMLALAKAHPQFEYINEYEEKDIAYCKIKRKNEPEVVRSFSMTEAKQAGLLEKIGPWKQYTKRMLQMRARGFALRDSFPDALKGIISREEAEDYPSEPIINADNSKATYIKNLITHSNVENTAIISEDEIISEKIEFETFSKMISQAANAEALNFVVEKIKNFTGTADEIENLRKMYKIRKEELSIINENAAAS